MTALRSSGRVRPRQQGYSCQTSRAGNSTMEGVMSGLGSSRWRAGPSQVVGGSDPSIAQADIARWLLRDYPRGPRYLPLLRAAVREACRALIRIALHQQGPPSYAAGAGGAGGGSTSGRVRRTRLLARMTAQ